MRPTKRNLSKRLEKIEPDDSDDPTLTVDLRGTGQAWRDEDADDVSEKELVTESGGICVFAEVDE